MSVYFEDKLVRYRTEAFSGLGEREAAKVMAFETFELGNTDILECLEKELLHNSGALRGRCLDFIDYLSNSGSVKPDEWAEFGFEDGVAFFRDVLAEIKKVTGLDIQYVLWLADKETVTDRGYEGYGRDMADDEDFESYQVGPVVLSDLGWDGTLYGYEVSPISLETQLESMENGLLYMQQERNGCVGNPGRARMLDDAYRRQFEQVQELREVVAQKLGEGLEHSLRDAEQRSVSLYDVADPRRLERGMDK